MRMSSIRSIDLMFVDELVNFIRGAGYVLDFSDVTFAQFFMTELDVDITAPTYAQGGTSKGKRLRTFLTRVDDATAVKTLNALWEYRAAWLTQTGRADPVSNAEGRFLALVRRLGGGAAAQTPQEAPRPAFDLARLTTFQQQLVGLSALPPQERGYAFERFLRDCFDYYGLKARSPFRNVGEQIDGSFVLGGDTYLLEAKWTASATSAAELHTFEGKLGQKAPWSRGLFISHCGFSADGLVAFGRAKRTLCMDGLDLHDALGRQIPLDQVIDRKARAAAETGSPFVPVRHLFTG
jgi:hypothetical protein